MHRETMSGKLKFMFRNKVVLHHSNQEAILPRNLGSVHLSYQHNKSCLLNTSSKKLQNLQETSQAFSTKNEQVIDSTQANVDKEIFIKTVINGIVNKKPEINQKPNNVVIDFSSPNIAKPFHAGHLRSTIIGNFIANIHKYYNNNVTKINYLGDWGTQFGLLQYGLKAKNVDLNSLKHNPIRTLYEAYVYANKISTTDESIQQQARNYFSDIEHGRSSLQTWKKIREVTIEELANVYKRLGIQFDDYHWESDYNGEAIKNVIDSLVAQNIVKTDSEGKKVAKVNDRDVTVMKSDSSTLYLSRDIAALLDRYKRYQFDKMLYVVDNSQTDHFAALFEIVKQLNGECTKGCQHVKFGRIKGMSTRSGDVVFLNDILDEAKDKMYEKQLQSKNTRNAAMNEETCDILGTTAVLINDLKQRRQKDYTFNWERALQTEGDSGIRLQYLHCRLWSLEQHSGVKVPHYCDPSYIPEEIVGEVIAELAKFDNVLCRALEEYEACIIVNYLFRLAKHVNRMFNELNVKNADADLAAQRLLVFHAARLVVKTSLEILGVKPLYEM